jgi:glutamate-ammonia-ligase adenylyltransferase
VTLDAFRAYYRQAAQPWERLALTRARVVYARGDFRQTVASALREALTGPADPAELAREAVAMRRRRECSRAVGGLADVEFLVQYLQLTHAPARPEVLRPNVWEALDALRDAGALDVRAHADLAAAYDFFRTVEGRLRIAHNRSGVAVPEDPAALARLARRLGYKSDDPRALADAFRADASRHAARARELFLQHVGGPANVTPCENGVP